MSVSTDCRPGCAITPLARNRYLVCHGCSSALEVLEGDTLVLEAAPSHRALCLMHCCATPVITHFASETVLTEFFLAQTIGRFVAG
jgi:hypothetical protein